MTDPYVPPDEPRRRPFGCLVAVGLVLLGFVGTALVLYRPAPSAGPSPLNDRVTAPAGYVPLDDAESGGGRLDASRAARLLSVGSLDGFRDGILHAWGRAPGEPSRAVVVLVVELRSPADATAARDAYAAARAGQGATAFATPECLRAKGFVDVPDEAGRHAQRVVFAEDTRLWVVSVVTPERETDHAEVIRLAIAQASGCRA